MRNQNIKVERLYHLSLDSSTFHAVLELLIIAHQYIRDDKDLKDSTRFAAANKLDDLIKFISDLENDKLDTDLYFGIIPISGVEHDA